MEWWQIPISEDEIQVWEAFLNDWFFVIALAFLGFELIRYGFLRKLSWKLMGDTLTNFITLGLFLGVTYFLLAAFYVGTYLYAHQFAVFDIPVNWATIGICIVLADLAYYWEHRFTHRVNIAWATHSVHHSSPFFNISVAYRFGPMDGVWPIFFHLPLVLLGFNPFLVFFAEVVVQLYQTALHTEVVKKLPKPVELIMNTPSHHRVHHGSNETYLDKNYAGIFIVWDRLFGTYAREDEDVVYGLTKPLSSVDPVTAFLHGFYRVGKKIVRMRSLSGVFGALFGPPDWEPKIANRS